MTKYSEKFKKIVELAEEIALAVEWPDDLDYSIEEVALLRHGAASGAIFTLQALTWDAEVGDLDAELDDIGTLIRSYLEVDSELSREQWGL